MTNNAEARAREVLDDFVPLSISSTWDEAEKRAILRATVQYGNERAAQEREANAAIARAYPHSASKPIGESIAKRILARGQQ